MIHRYEHKGARWYYSTKEINGLPPYTLVPSVTTVLQATSPTPHGLLKWYAELGWDGAQQRKREAADYGTCFHTLAEWMLQTNCIDVENALNFYLLQKHNKNLEYSVELLVRLEKDLAALATFFDEKEVRVIYNEFPGIGDFKGNGWNKFYAGTTDLVCEMTFNRKRVVALIDYKTGNVYPSSATQLAAYSDIVQQNTDYTIDMLFNWQPSDWTKDTPTYKLTNQTDDYRDEMKSWGYKLAEFELRYKQPTEHITYKSEIRPGADLAPIRTPIKEWLMGLNKEVQNV